jgi:hypothetical protein
MKDIVLVKAIYIYFIQKNVLDRIITLETYFEGLGNLQAFSQ